ncbi:hypothetical protein TWF106_008118 [Orbilia oligospora]|uniref:Uncharacterized protein n=1 Tax=Orbilia oligospora TaxID=2813651 RepID=A0A6G1LYV6_ORBOL|nr:hypothetical protein TWF788_008808 [Orbilia oligospora]KAF3208308.1 hypothetical protein TWF191_000701 [Orbilia oligospora]KAF3214893.1 hypothetical protein TWF679_004671 [Orbilia oligospora]KAF3217069.1 hypothetical protein TWF106_008118 [Orbilia oligospora]KAF3239083.1 hypothetical protein TWF192_010161 [Orbilia oligospora]
MISSHISPRPSSPQIEYPAPSSRPPMATGGSHNINNKDSSNGGGGQPEDAAYSLLLQENKMLKITILELHIAQCRNLALIDRFVNGQVNDPENGPPSRRQRVLRNRMEELEARLLEMREECDENTGLRGNDNE